MNYSLASTKLLALINENIALLEELELKCSCIDHWRSLAKPVADSIIRMREEVNCHIGAQFHGSMSGISHMCNACNMLIGEDMFHHWLFDFEYMQKLRCQKCLYPR